MGLTDGLHPQNLCGTNSTYRVITEATNPPSHGRSKGYTTRVLTSTKNQEVGRTKQPTLLYIGLSQPISVRGTRP